jgi:hypothetical protein
LLSASSKAHGLLSVTSLLLLSALPSALLLLCG